MEHLHEEIDPLDIDKAGYYVPKFEEIFLGCTFEAFIENQWYYDGYVGGLVQGTYNFVELLNTGNIRMKYIQAKDIMELGFPRISPSIPMYQRGSYMITAYRLLDPTYSRIKVSQNGVTVFEGHVKNKSELKRVLILNEINFVE
jgi:hypothetical protein